MTTTTTQHQTITEQHIDQFRNEGYFVLERALPPEHLELLRGLSDTAVAEMDARMDAAGTDQLSINLRGKRYFADKLWRTHPELDEVLFSPLMAEVCRATIGPEAYLFWEQFVIKGPDPDSKLAWHQDSGYVHENHKPYVTVWMALDDVDERNGSVYLLPYSRIGVRSYIKHVEDERTHDHICYFGSDPGDPVVVPAGSVVVFSSVLVHRSGPNLTDQMRRVYLAQYSPEVILTQDGSAPWSESKRFLDAGRNVAR